MKFQHFLGAAATIAVMTAGSTVDAETVHTKKLVKTKTIESTKQIPFSTFDVNEDGMYAKEEVGEALFYLFDTDGNEVIDNIEWDKETVLTITPMEMETYKFVDYNDDGATDLSTYTYETFYKESGLIRFDEDKNGLSAAEFINEGYKSLDDNQNGTIELDEWKEAYEISLSPPNAEQERYN